MNRWLVPLASGVLFGSGLVVSGMTQPAKVIGFLDVTGRWDPSLALVMVGAIAVHFVAWRLVPRLGSPVWAGAFAIPTRRDIDARLVAGAALFGVGWGLAGLCPGPAVVSLASGGAEAILFAGAMAAGMLAHRAFER